jgi:predicted nuclease of predicted toxin-antitoxin system
MVVLHLLLDHNVPDSVAQVFRERGHKVELVRDILPTDSPDPLIATVSEEDGAILVSCDRDFKIIAPRIPRGYRTRFRKLSRISLQCSEPQAAQRVKAAMSLIEAEYEIARGSSDKRMFIVIQNDGIKTHR